MNPRILNKLSKTDVSVGSGRHVGMLLPIVRTVPIRMGTNMARAPYKALV